MLNFSQEFDLTPTMHHSPDSPIQLEGQLLLAAPSMRDEMFNKSVVLLAEYNEKNGAYGLILNHPTRKNVGDILSSEDFKKLRHIPVRLGGPVKQENLTFAALWASPLNQQDQQRIVHYATRISAQDAIARSMQPGNLICAFAGYSKWEAGQLEQEIRSNSWIHTLPSPKILTVDHTKSLWSETLRGISPYHQILAETPNDIYVN